ncbi:MAG: STAS domain-containing protein [Lachnospiraceae bacterium]|nr:STAS domain-containing protein [Lachnospiraceae bacterium]
MNIEKKTEGSTLNIAVSGRLDTNTAPELEKEIKAISAEIQQLNLDFKGLEYISSAGLRVLLQGQKLMNKQGSMVVKNINETIREIFEITGFADILTVK